MRKNMENEVGTGLISGNIGLVTGDWQAIWVKVIKGLYSIIPF